MSLKVRIPAPYNNDELKQLICMPFTEEYEDVLLHRVERIVQNDIGLAYINIVKCIHQKTGIEAESDHIKFVKKVSEERNDLLSDHGKLYAQLYFEINGKALEGFEESEEPIIEEIQKENDQ